MKSFGPVVATACLSVLTMAPAAPAAAAAPVGWLGDGTAHYPAGSAAGTWSLPASEEWSVTLPSWGNSSPVVHGERVFLTVEPTTLLAVSLKDGRVLWKHDATYAETVPRSERAAYERRLAEAEAISKQLRDAERAYNKLKRDMRTARAAQDGTAAKLEAAGEELARLMTELEPYDDIRPPEPIPEMGSASATPVTDGEAVYAVFGNGVVLARTVSGKPLWARYLGKPKVEMRGYHRGQAASPQLVDGVLVVAMNTLFGLDPKTGATRWTGPEYIEYGAPTPVKLGDGKRYVVTPGGDVVRASDGHVATRGIAMVYFVSPGARGDQIFFVGADRNPGTLSRTATALRLTARGDAVEADTLWRTTLESERTFTCPVIHEGILYALGEGSTLSALKVADGSILYEEKVDLGHDAAYATPVVAGDSLVAIGLGGKVSVVRLGPTFGVLATHAVEGGRAMPAFAGSDLVLRGMESIRLVGTGGASDVSGRRITP